MRADVLVEVGEHLLGDGTEGAAPIGEPDSKRPPVAQVGRPLDEPSLLQEADERGHGLLRDPRAHRECPHPKTVFLEEREQHRAIGRSHLVEAATP